MSNVNNVSLPVGLLQNLFLGCWLEVLLWLQNAQFYLCSSVEIHSLALCHLQHLTGVCLVHFNFQLDAKWQIFWLYDVCIANTESVVQSTLKCYYTSIPMSVWDTQYEIVLNLITELTSLWKKKEKKNLQITFFPSCIRNFDLFL